MTNSCAPIVRNAPTAAEPAVQPAELADDVDGFEARRAARSEMMAATDALIAEFADAVPAGTVIRHLALAREHLLAAGIRAGLAPAAEAMARFRLAKLVAPHGVPG